MKRKGTRQVARVGHAQTSTTASRLAPLWYLPRVETSLGKLLGADLGGGAVVWGELVPAPRLHPINLTQLCTALVGANYFQLLEL